MYLLRTTQPVPDDEQTPAWAANAADWEFRIAVTNIVELPVVLGGVAGYVVYPQPPVEPRRRSSSASSASRRTWCQLSGSCPSDGATLITRVLALL